MQEVLVILAVNVAQVVAEVQVLLEAVAVL
jgi:hypothetical protein